MGKKPLWGLAGFVLAGTVAAGCQSTDRPRLINRPLFSRGNSTPAAGAYASNGTYGAQGMTASTTTPSSATPTTMSMNPRQATGLQGTTMSSSAPGGMSTTEMAPSGGMPSMPSTGASGMTQGTYQPMPSGAPSGGLTPSTPEGGMSGTPRMSNASPAGYSGSSMGMPSSPAAAASASSLMAPTPPASAEVPTMPPQGTRGADEPR